MNNRVSKILSLWNNKLFTLWEDREKTHKSESCMNKNSIIYAILCKVYV